MSRPKGSKNKPKIFDINQASEILQELNSIQNNETDVNNLEQNSHTVEVNSQYSMNIPFFDELLMTDAISYEQLEIYIKYPMKYNRQLRRISRQLYSMNGQYTKTVDTMTNLAKLDFITTCYKSIPKNQVKRQLFNQLMRRINHKGNTRNIIKSLLLDGIYVGMLRTVDENNKNMKIQEGFVESLERIEGLALENGAMLQQFDADNIKIIGYTKNQELVAAFDMMYFDQYYKGNGLIAEIKNYPKEFIQAYSDYRKDATKRWYKLDPNITIALTYKATKNEAWGRPLCIASIPDIFFANLYNDSQRANVTENASNIVTLTLPMGEKQGQCSLDKKQQENLVKVFNNAVYANTKGTSSGRVAKTNTMTLPPGASIGKLSKDASLLKDTLTNENIKKISTGLGLASSLLNGEGDGNYSSLSINIEIVASDIFAILEQISYEYTKIFNNYLFTNSAEVINMEYLKITTINQEEMFQRSKDLYTFGGSITHVIASAGFDVDTYIETLKYERENDYYDDINALFYPHVTSYTFSDSMDTANPNTEDNKGGRPEDNKSKNDNTLASKSHGTNRMKKPSNK